MSQISNYSENKIINLVLRNTAWTTPTVYISAHTADPGETGANELAGGGYARVAAPTFSAAASRAIASTTELKFPLMLAAVGTITHLAAWDAMSGGNLLWYSSSITSPITTAVGIVPTFASGVISISLSGEISTYLANKLLDHIFRATTYTSPGTSLYTSLHTADPGLTGASEVPSTNAYARVQVTTWDSPSDGATANTSAITYPIPTPSSWATVSYFGIWDAATSGNFLLSANMDASIATTAGVAPAISAGEFDVVVQ